MKTLCLVLVFCLLLPLASCGKTETLEDIVFGEEFEGFPEGHPPTALYLQCSGVNAFLRERESLLPEDAAQLVDMIFLAFARFDGDEIAFPEIPEELRDYQTAGISLLICFGANDTASAAHLREISRDPDRTKAFAQRLVSGAKERGLDGVDVDWETVSGPTAAGMNTIVSALREAGGEDFLLTCAVPCSSWGLSGLRFDLPTLARQVDYFNLMSYDLGVKGAATHVTPLWPSEEDGGLGIGGVNGVATLLKNGVEPGQILLGCAGYGKVYRTEGDAALGVAGKKVKLDLPGSYDTGTLLGKGLEAVLADPAWESRTEESERGFVGSYLTNGDLFLTYDSTESYAAKYDFACRAGCGLMLWSLTQDTADRFFSVLRDKNNA